MLTTSLHSSPSFPLYTQPGAPCEDPREALLKLDAAATAEPMYFGAAYKNTQPQGLSGLASTTIEEELEEAARKKKAARHE